MGTFHKEDLPSAERYCEHHGLPLIPPRGKWRSTRCDLCGASKAMRINTESNGWCCMSCGQKGGDMLALHIALTGMDFVSAARELGAYVDDDKPGALPRKARAISAGDALELLYQDAMLVWVAAQNLVQGVVLTKRDIDDLTAATRRVLLVTQEVPQ
jgi:hypothetical protein